jgi:hypothetical protein
MTPELPRITSPQALRDLVKDAAVQCQCSLARNKPWDSISETDWPDHMRRVATLADPEISEPTFEEFHPDGTRYDSVNAPVALMFFPFNRCDVWLCTRCKVYWLRYTEFGGYYVDHRARALDVACIVDNPRLR